MTNNRINTPILIIMKKKKILNKILKETQKLNNKKDVKKEPPKPPKGKNQLK